MTKEEVRKILGSPTDEGKHSQWTWEFDNPVSHADMELYYIHFTDGVVDDMNHVRSYFDKNQGEGAEAGPGHLPSKAAANDGL
jgi:outer membrane protein assembly factor BamE (lipoprotein component of BamABCDE complex)